MAVSEKKRAAFAGLIARQKEKRKNESLDGRKDSKSNNSGISSSQETGAGLGAVGVGGGGTGDPVVGGDPGDRGSEQGNVTGSPGDLGGGQRRGGKGAPGEDRAGSERSGARSRTVGTRPRSELSPEERNFTIEPGSEPQPAGRKKRLEANLAAIKLLKKLELEDRHASPEEKQILAKYNGFGADKEVFNSSMAQYRTFANRDSYEFYAGRKVLVLKEGLDAETVYARLQPVLNGVSRAEFAAQLEKLSTADLGLYLSDKLYVAQHSLYAYLERALKEANPFSVKTEGGWEQIYGRWYDEFREVMSDEEWEAASRSSLNSHYTPAWMCHRIWGPCRKNRFFGRKSV
jgi:hypothetical protein